MTILLGGLLAVAFLFAVVFPCVSHASELPVLRVLSTPTCPACAQMFRVLDELGSKYGGKLKTEKINLLEHRDIAKEFKVRYVPHVLFVDKDGKVVKEEVGHVPLEKVVTIFKDAGINLE